MASVGYDHAAHVLEAEFRNGAVYRYFAVPASLVRQLLRAASIGSFFNAHVRDRFPFLRV